MMEKDYKQIKVSPCGAYHTLSGQAIYNRTFVQVMKFHTPGLAPVEDKTGSYHIDAQGEAVYTQRYKKTYGFYDNYAAVIDDQQCWFHIDPKGDTIYDERYQWCGNFQEGCCVVQSKNGYQHISKSGYFMHSECYDYIGDYKDGIAVAVKNGKYFHINIQGERINDHSYLFLDIFHKKFARAQDDQGWFHINQQGLPVYACRYKYIEPFYNSIALVQSFDNQFMRIDEKGDRVEIITKVQANPANELSAKMVGFWPNYIIFTALDIGVFDFIPENTKTLAKDCQIDQECMLRLLRGLWELGIVNYEDSRWQLTDLGQLLSPAKDSFMASASAMWLAVMQQWQSQELPKLIRQKKPQYHPCFKDSANVGDLRIYHKALIGYAKNDFPSLCDYVQLTQKANVFVAGTCARAILPQLAKHYPQAHLVYYDSTARLRDFVLWDIFTNIKTASFDLFAAWPGRYDYIIFPRYLHYWPDQDVSKLLVYAIQALMDHGKLFIFEMLINEDTPQGSLLDLNMLVETGGKLRSKVMWVNLMKKQNCVLTKIIPIKNCLTMLEFCRGSTKCST